MACYGNRLNGSVGFRIFGVAHGLQTLCSHTPTYSLKDKEARGEIYFRDKDEDRTIGYILSNLA